jgi:hypothetical protein
LPALCRVFGSKRGDSHGKFCFFAFARNWHHICGNTLLGCGHLYKSSEKGDLYVNQHGPLGIDWTFSDVRPVSRGAAADHGFQGAVPLLRV